MHYKKILSVMLMSSIILGAGVPARVLAADSAENVSVQEVVLEDGENTNEDMSEESTEEEGIVGETPVDASTDEAFGDGSVDTGTEVAEEENVSQMGIAEEEAVQEGTVSKKAARAAAQADTVQAENDLWTGIFQDAGHTQLADNVTQEKIDQVKSKIDAMAEGQEKTDQLALADRASQLLQQMTFTGLGNTKFAHLFFSADGTDRARLQINKGKPHSYISNVYLKVRVLDPSGNEVYLKELLGNVSNSATTEQLPLSEGSTLEITKTEPGRFYTNHNDELKQNDSNPYVYLVKNHRLLRIDDKNRTLVFTGLGNATYATMRIDYNGKKLCLQTNNAKPHVYFSDSYMKIEVLNLKGEIVFTKDFIGTERCGKNTEYIPFETGYKIRLTGKENVRVIGKDERGNRDTALALKERVEGIILQGNGPEREFFVTQKMAGAYVSAFQQRIGQEKLDAIRAQSPEHSQFIDWILGNTEALQNYLSGGYASPSTQRDMGSYSYRNPLNPDNEEKALNLWQQIWAAYPESREGTSMKIAIAVSLEFANGMRAWPSGAEVDPLLRFKDLSDAEKNDVLMSDFPTYSIQEMRNVVNAKIVDEDVKWLRSHITENHAGMLNRSGITRGYSLLKYRSTNPDTGASVHGSQFYGPNPTIREVVKYGGVCGAMSKFSSILAQCYGVPALPVGQPGHCAYEYLDVNHNYQLGYDVSGWQKTANYNTNFPFMKLCNELRKQNEKYEESDYHRYEAVRAANADQAIAELEKAVEILPMNYRAWEELVQQVSANRSQEELEGIYGRIRQLFTGYPVISEYLTKDAVKEEIRGVFADEQRTRLSSGVTRESLQALDTKAATLPEGAARTEYQGIVEKAGQMVRQINVMGLGNGRFGQLNFYEDGSGQLTWRVRAGKPHSYINGKYFSITVTAKDGTVRLNQELNGNTSYAKSEETVTLAEGDQIELYLKEKNRISADTASLTEKVPSDNIYRYEIVGGKLTVKAQ